MSPQIKAALISTPIPLKALKTEKDLQQSPWRSEYATTRNHHFAKMNRSTSISIPMLRSQVPAGRNVLFSMLIFHYKQIPDMKHTYELLCC
mmetsp:Transcript_12062/g.21929  ORF Transcript_12062/g.21929 Transcript_12062/m.21929 type:complete len:91 (+) Transcript_12062:3345-3617(+)